MSIARTSPLAQFRTSARSRNRCRRRLRIIARPQINGLPNRGIERGGIVRLAGEDLLCNAASAHGVMHLFCALCF